MSDTPAEQPDEAGTDWDRERDGRMADHATPDDAVQTVRWRPGQGAGA